jgi:hypothetical protein
MTAPRGRAAWACALALLLAPGCRSEPAADVRPADLRALEARRDELRGQLARALAADARLQAAPRTDVLIGVPAAFTGALARELTRGFLSQVEIRLRGLRLHKQDHVDVKALVATLRAGSYDVDVQVHEVTALLRPGEPRVEFDGARVKLRLPVRLAEGRGRARVDFRWDSQGVGKVVCEDFDVSQEVSAGVTPRTYELSGAFTLEVEDGALVARPDFPERLLKVNVEPAAETWEAVERVVQERTWKCEKALGAVDVPKLLRGLLAKGFDVRLPRRLFKPVRLPAAFEQSLAIEGRTYDLLARPADLALGPGMLWYGAALELRPRR